MKKISFATMTAIALVGMLFISACNTDEGNTETTTQTCSGGSLSLVDGDTLSPSTYAGQNVTVAADATITLSGAVYIPSDCTITLNPGVTVKAKSEFLSYLAIKQGGKIMAEGTAAKPIVFTSDKAAGSRLSSDWGGIVIHGKAPVNNSAGVNIATDTEIYTGPYGGETKADNSGVLKYVRIEFAGREISSGKEFNGLFLAGVGSGTTIQYVQTHRGSDDGIEIFGGTVSLSHIVITHNEDDGFDLDEGWSGSAHHFIIASSNYTDAMIEYDGLGADQSRATQSFFSNFTIVGDTKAGGKIFDVKANGQLVLVNSLIANFTDRHIKHAAQATEAPSSTFFSSTGLNGITDNNTLNGNFVSALLSNKFEKVTASGTAITDVAGLNIVIDNETTFDQIANNEFAAAMTSLTAPTTYWGEGGAANFKPAASTATVSTFVTTNMTNWAGVSMDLTGTNYVGAIDPAGTNWAETWTNFSLN